MKKPSRRTVLTAMGLGVAGLGVHAWTRGLRYPPLQYDPEPLPESGYHEDGWRVHVPGGAFVRENRTGGFLTLRAYVPEPKLRFEGTRGGRVQCLLENVHHEVEVEGVPESAWSFVRPETGDPGAREELLFDFELPFGTVREVKLRFPERAVYRFAAIGDTGGGSELRWCLERAEQLDADFMLHLGDLYYLEKHEEQAEASVRSAEMPVYAAVGNHDFHGGFRNRFEQFMDDFGPLNAHFRLAGVDFVNLDTAADTVPYGGGERGELMEEVEAFRAEAGAAPLVVFTHRPLSDWRHRKGRREEPHALNRSGEAALIAEWIEALGEPHVLLAGHIHRSKYDDGSPVPTWIAGEGTSDLGPDATLLLATFARGEMPSFEWKPLAMPAGSIDPEMVARQGANAYQGFGLERP